MQAAIISRMAAGTQPVALENTPFARSSKPWLLIGLLALGLFLRLFNAAYRFLNADEALHYLLSVQNSTTAAYRASLTTVHPPLLILWLHYWQRVGHSEFLLRLPCVVAGTLFCWVVFCWLKRVTNDSTALFGLVLLLFSPPLIQLSAEVRQYSFLLLFCALSLYYLERGILENSVGWTILSAVALYLALLTHYSSLIFALTLGIYAIVRFVRAQPRIAVFTSWIAGQIVALGIVAFLYVHHISKIEASGATETIADTYLSRSVLQQGQNVLWFIGRSNLRVFHYFFSQGAVGVVALLLFIAGIVFLIKGTKTSASRAATPRQIALLLVFPLVVNCVLGIFRAYPYGGSRHNSYLSIFIFTAIAVALDHWRPSRRWLTGVTLALVLAICNLFPASIDQYLPFRDQNRHQMAQAVAALRATPKSSIIFTDDQGGLLLSYYMCGSKVAQIEQSPFQPFLRSRCGEHEVISIDPDWWIFKAETFPQTIRDLQQTYGFIAGTHLSLFQAGWFIHQESALREELQQYGCQAPRDFGHNVFICSLTLPGN